ncbi:uncharacterized protein RSE6_06343 [Rhynchosporium secalis]|uniref:Uncharacterized protein n=1 Tax=Rhynchosporium secalis TaxID=38038 RepID=A0A1E1MA79_RHYSE|nr:uncharacterized protein RSE6_06343 [Rhynchosporium secalis]
MMRFEFALGFQTAPIVSHARLMDSIFAVSLSGEIVPSCLSPDEMSTEIVHEIDKTDETRYSLDVTQMF